MTAGTIRTPWGSVDGSVLSASVGTVQLIGSLAFTTPQKKTVLQISATVNPDLNADYALMKAVGPPPTQPTFWTAGLYLFTQPLGQAAIGYEFVSPTFNTVPATQGDGGGRRIWGGRVPFGDVLSLNLPQDGIELLPEDGVFIYGGMLVDGGVILGPPFIQTRFRVSVMGNYLTDPADQTTRATRYVARP